MTFSLEGVDILDPSLFAVLESIYVRARSAFQQNMNGSSFLKLGQELILHYVHIFPGESQVLKGVKAADPA